MKKTLLPFMTGLLLLALAACGAEATPVEPTALPEIPLATEAPATEAALAVPTEAPTQTAAAPVEVSFSKDVMPILSEYCARCHGVDDVKEGLDLTTYDALMQGSFNGPVIVPGNANESLLADLISKGKMPKRGEKPTPDMVQVIINWINAGALNN